MKFQYVTIAVSNLEKSRHFYSSILGFNESHVSENWIGYQLEHHAGFGIIEDMALAPRTSVDIINFTISDFETRWLKIKDQVHVENPPETMPWGTHKFVIRDPDNMRIAFIDSEERTR